MEYTRLIFYPEKIGSSEDVFNLKMRLSAWHFATMLKDEKAKEHIMTAPPSLINFVYACQLYDSYMKKKDLQDAKSYEKNPKMLADRIKSL
jgi:hypothetical protein